MQYLSTHLDLGVLENSITCNHLDQYLIPIFKCWVGVIASKNIHISSSFQTGLLRFVFWEKQLFLESQGIWTEFYLYHRPRKKGRKERWGEKQPWLRVQGRGSQIRAYTLSMDPFWKTCCSSHTTQYSFNVGILCSAYFMIWGEKRSYQVFWKNRHRYGKLFEPCALCQTCA